jgi:hypothetical protein
MKYIVVTDGRYVQRTTPYLLLTNKRARAKRWSYKPAATAVARTVRGVVFEASR